MPSLRFEVLINFLLWTAYSGIYNKECPQKEAEFITIFSWKECKKLKDGDTKQCRAKTQDGAEGSIYAKCEVSGNQVVFWYQETEDEKEADMKKIHENMVEEAFISLYEGARDAEIIEEKNAGCSNSKKENPAPRNI